MARHRGGYPARMRRWTILSAALIAALCVTLVLLVRENRRLREQVTAMAGSRARAGGLAEGQVLGPVRLRGAAGSEIEVRFEGESSGTVLLFFATGCGACEATAPRWRAAISRAARPDVRVVCVQTDAGAGVAFALEGLPASVAVPLPPVGWLAALPAVPATLIVDEHGRVVRAWYGELSEREAEELAEAIRARGTRN